MADAEQQKPRAAKIMEEELAKLKAEKKRAKAAARLRDANAAALKEEGKALDGRPGGTCSWRLATDTSSRT